MCFFFPTFCGKLTFFFNAQPHQIDPLSWLRAIIFFGMGGGGRVPNILRDHKFFERKMGGCHKIFDNQNVENHKMTTDSMFILFKETDFNTILACLGGKVYRWWGVIKFLLPK